MKVVYRIIVSAVSGKKTYPDLENSFFQSKPAAEPSIQAATL